MVVLWGTFPSETSHHYTNGIQSDQYNGKERRPSCRPQRSTIRWGGGFLFRNYSALLPRPAEFPSL